MARKSIRRRLVALLIGVLAAAWVGIGAATWVDAHREIDVLLDAHLAQSARLVIAQVGDEPEELDLEDLEDVPGYRQRVALQAWIGGTQLVLRSPAAPGMRLSPVETGFSDAVHDGQRWRVFSGWDDEHEVLVQVGEDHAARERIAGRIARNALWPLLFALPVVGLLVWWVVGRGLRPLRELGSALAQRGPQDLRPLGLDDPPLEVAPVAETIDRLLGRISQSLDAERSFTAHAAHEMRTPMAAIRAQAEVARDASDAGVRQAALGRVVEACDRAARLVTQLLLLARVDEDAAGVGRVRCRLDDVVRRTLAEQAPAAMARGVTIELEADAADVYGDPALLEAMARNLVDNAIRHGGPGTVRVAVERNAQGVRLAVEDSGPGIEEAEREQLGRRFFRGESAHGPGSGLGLSIVSRIADLHGARLVFMQGGNGRGLRTEVHFGTQAGDRR